MAQHATFFFGGKLFIGLCAVVLCAGLGCAKKQPLPAVAPPPPPQQTAATDPAVPTCDTTRDTLYDEGVCAYDAGEIKRAVSLWREALKVETDQALRQRTRFALATVRLSQAASDTEYAAALDLFDAWAKASPAGGSGEDPRFLLPVLHAVRPAAVLKDQKATMERECAKKLTTREEQVRKSLQQQVRALETIHQQIQEKKKGLSNY
jgi:hypothetical protein